MTTTHFPTSSGRTPRSKMSSSVSTREGSLPKLRMSSRDIDKTKPLPTSLQSEFLPDEVLLAITQPPPHYDKLGPLNRYRNLDTTSGIVKKKPAGVWTHGKSRDRYKHLTDNTPCVCGAGRDVSFLYDVPLPVEIPLKRNQFDPTEIRNHEEDIDEAPKKKEIRLPDTLIPEEYHIVKNKGVMGLEYYEDAFGAHPKDHESHLVMFPSMKPSSRYEVVQLKKTLTDMMSHAGLDEEDWKMDGPTQMHNLLEIIKKEQDIYNVVFHELIRQVTIECVERGELLSEVRSRYTQLINKIPRQCKGLHEEVLAQRALDRRLTEELMRFKNTIWFLTSELSEVREHDKQVTQEASVAQSELRAALAESGKNSSLLAEYHDLYELQRNRLEKNVKILSDEKEIWSTAAYSLALKVTEEHSLTTAKRLNVNEKSWAKLATHFSILLSDKDTEVLTELQGYVDNWRDMLTDFNTVLQKREHEMREQVINVHDRVKKWVGHFQRNVLTHATAFAVKYMYRDALSRPSKDGHFKQPPDPKKVAVLYEDIKKFQETLAHQSELFGGDTLLSGLETIHAIQCHLDHWTDCAMPMFVRHGGNDGENHPEHDAMLVVNEEVEALLDQFRIRITGENGSASGMINAMNSMELWDVKFTALLHGNNPLPEQDWLRFYTAMDDWVQYLEKTCHKMGATQKEEDKVHIESLDVPVVVNKVQKWLSNTNSSIDSEDAKLVEEVTSLHTEMIKWMVHLLLRLAPDREDHTQEARDAVLLGSATIAEIQSGAKLLFDRLERFTQRLGKCCIDIVNKEMQVKLAQSHDDPDAEMRDLKRLKAESQLWIKTAELLLREMLSKNQEAMQYKPSLTLEAAVTDEQPATQSAPAVVIDAAPIEPERQVSVSNPEMTLKERPPPMGGPSLSTTGTEPLEVIGHDENTHNTTLGDLHHPINTVPDAEDVPNTKTAFEALASVSKLQGLLVQTEERALVAETRQSELEGTVMEQHEKMRELERQIRELQSLPEESEHSVITAKSSLETTKPAPIPAVAAVFIPTPRPVTPVKAVSKKSSPRPGKKPASAGKKK